MKMRVLAGIRDANPKDPVMGTNFWPISFPMMVINYNAANATDPDEISIQDEDELIAWAEDTYGELGYEFITLDNGEQPTPRNLIVHVPQSVEAQTISGLISAKKAQYVNTAPQTAEGRYARDAVVSALDTLELHALTALKATSPR